MDGQHLDGVGVGLQPPAALLVAGVAVGLGDPPAQPGGQRGRAELLGRAPRRAAARRRGAGRSAAARRRRATRIRSGSRSATASVSASEAIALLAQHPRPVVQAAVDVLPLLLAGAGHALGAPAEEAASARRSARARERPGAPAPPAASATRAPGSVANTLPAPLITAGTPAASSASRMRAALRLVGTSTAMSPGATCIRRPACARCPPRRRGPRGRPPSPCGSRRARRRQLDARVVAAHDPDAQRRARAARRRRSVGRAARWR